MDAARANQILSQLASTGLPPRDIASASEELPLFSVGLDEWIERLEAEYLVDLCRRNSYFKLVLAPYGGGKTHFLMALGVRGLAANFAVSYVACVQGKGGGARVDDPLGLYCEVVGQLQLPGLEGKGMSTLLSAIVDRKRSEIEASGAADVDGAFSLYRAQLRKRFSGGEFGDFAQVMSEALKGHWAGETDAVAVRGAEKWLEGRLSSISKDEWSALGLKTTPASRAADLGRRLLLALARVTEDAGFHGLVLLIDEVETMFTAKGKSLQAVLGAMRAMVDWSGAGQTWAPIFGVFAAVPDVVESFSRYPALQQRFAIVGAPFEQGNDASPVIDLAKVGHDQSSLLAEIGGRLVDVAVMASGDKLDRAVQLETARKLAKVAARQNLDVDSRRLYVKAWASMLKLQLKTGSRSISETELAERYRGEFDEMRKREKEFEG